MEANKTEQEKGYDRLSIEKENIQTKRGIIKKSEGKSVYDKYGVKDSDSVY
jgi:hypothetical protein